MNLAPLAAFGANIARQEQAYNNHLLSLELKKQRLINVDFDDKTIQELMKEDPRGLLTVLYEESLSKRIKSDKVRNVWRTACNILPTLKREDLTYETVSMISHVHIKNHGSSSDYIKHFGTLALTGILWGFTGFKFYRKLEYRFAKKFLAEN